MSYAGGDEGKPYTSAQIHIFILGGNNFVHFYSFLFKLLIPNIKIKF